MEKLVYFTEMGWIEGSLSEEESEKQDKEFLKSLHFLFPLSSFLILLTLPKSSFAIESIEVEQFLRWFCTDTFADKTMNFIYSTSSALSFYYTCVENVNSKLRASANFSYQVTRDLSVLQISRSFGKLYFQKIDLKKKAVFYNFLLKNAKN
jgi:hypothetical protein